MLEHAIPHQQRNTNSSFVETFEGYHQTHPTPAIVELVELYRYSLSFATPVIGDGNLRWSADAETLLYRKQKSALTVLTVESVTRRL